MLRVLLAPFRKLGEVLVLIWTALHWNKDGD